MPSIFRADIVYKETWQLRDQILHIFQSYMYLRSNNKHKARKSSNHSAPAHL